MRSEVFDNEAQAICREFRINFVTWMIELRPNFDSVLKAAFGQQF
jgi:hypothetical protein